MPQPLFSSTSISQETHYTSASFVGEIDHSSVPRSPFGTRRMGAPPWSRSLMALVRVKPALSGETVRENRNLTNCVDPGQRPMGRAVSEGQAVLSFKTVEEVCESKKITLVLHPAIRRAVGGYEESFYIGLRCFLKGETDGLFFLPLQDGGYVRLIFSQRHSAGGHPILRVDPLTSEGLQRIKAAVDPNN